MTIKIGYANAKVSILLLLHGYIKLFNNTKLWNILKIFINNDLLKFLFFFSVMLVANLQPACSHMYKGHPAFHSGNTLASHL